MRSSVINFILSAVIFLHACQSKFECIDETDKLIVAILDDVTKIHPLPFFIVPLQKNEEQRNIMLKDISDLEYGINEEFGLADLSTKELDQIELELNKISNYKECQVDKEMINLNYINSDLDFKIEFTNHSFKDSVFRYQIDGPEGIFSFSNLMVLSYRNNLIYSMVMVYNCGKLCRRSRLYFLDEFLDEYKILGYKNVDLYEIH